MQGSDTAVFTDDDGRQYLFTALAGDTGWNVSDCLYQLAPDCLSAVKFKRLGTGGEAPAIFKHEGVYYLLHSHLTGLNSNDNFYHTATNLWGPWQAKGNIAQGEHSPNTFITQTMDVVPVAGKRGAFIWIGDSIRNNVDPNTPHGLAARHDQEFGRDGTPLARLVGFVGFRKVGTGGVPEPRRTRVAAKERTERKADFGGLSLFRGVAGFVPALRVP